MKEKCTTIPTLFHHYFLSNFNINDFLDNNEVYIREYAINDYIKNASLSVKKKRLSAMLYLYRDCIFIDRKNMDL